MSLLKKVAFAAFLVGGFFALVEAALWAAGTTTLLAEADPFAGFSRSVRVFEEIPSRGVLATAPRAARLSFNYQEFSSRKPEGSLRIFTLGGSSAYGFPYGGDVAFTRLLGEALRAALPGRNVEAINASGMSYGSHRLRILAHELALYEPDVFVVFEGHNEFIERSFYADLRTRSEAMDPLRKALHGWRLYSLLTRLLVRTAGVARPDLPPPASKGHSIRSSTQAGGAGAVAVTPPHGGRAFPLDPPSAGDRAASADGGSSAGEVGPLLGLDVERDERGRITEADRAEVLGRFEENLEAIVGIAKAAGASVILCTVPTNVRDWRPNQPLFPPDLAAEDRARAGDLIRAAARELDSGAAAGALDDLAEARSLAPSHAGAHFLAGRALEALERYEEAREAYRLARDTDGQPARATTTLIEAIRRVAARTGARLAEIEGRFEEVSPHGLVGFNLLEDYVHPTPEGHRLIAFELYRSILEGGLAGEIGAADPAVFDGAIERAPAADPAGPSPRPGTQKADLLFNLGVVLRNQGHTDRAIEKYREALAVAPDHFPARCNLGWLLYRRGSLEAAAAEFQEAIERGGSHLNCLVGHGRALSALGKPLESEKVFRRATEIDPSSAAAWTGLGSVLAQRGRLDEAIEALGTAVDRDGEDVEALANLGQALVHAGRLEEAMRTLRAALRIEHDHRRARLALAAALVQSGDYDEAGKLYRAALDSEPADPWAREGLEQVRALQRGR